MELRNKVSGIAHDTNVAKLTVLGLPRPEYSLHQLFTPLAEAGINVDAIAHSAEPAGDRADCAFTVAEADLGRALEITRARAAALGAGGVHEERAVAKVSIVGLGVQDTPGLAARVFATLGQADIPIDMVTTSQVRITCLVPEARMVEAVRLLHAAFELQTPPLVVAVDRKKRHVQGQTEGSEALVLPPRRIPRREVRRANPTF